TLITSRVITSDTLNVALPADRACAAARRRLRHYTCQRLGRAVGIGGRRRAPRGPSAVAVWGIGRYNFVVGVSGQPAGGSYRARPHPAWGRARPQQRRFPAVLAPSYRRRSTNPPDQGDDNGPGSRTRHAGVAGPSNALLRLVYGRDPPRRAGGLLAGARLYGDPALRLYPLGEHA